MSRSNEADLGVVIPAWVRSLAISSVENFTPMVRRRFWILSYGSAFSSSLGGLGLGGFRVGGLMVSSGKVLLVGCSWAKLRIREKPLVPSCSARSCGSKSSLGGLMALSGAGFFLLSMSRKRSKGGFSTAGDTFFGGGLFGGGSSGDGGLKGGPDGAGLCCDGLSRSTDRSR